VTRANAKRRTFYQAQLAKTTSPRLRLWAAWRWLLAEASRAGGAGQRHVADRLEAIAAELNGADQ
jgi:ribosomal protein S7